MTDRPGNSDEALIRAGLALVDDAATPDVAPFDAWKTVIGTDVVPDVVVPDDDPDYLDKAEQEWRDIATRERLLGHDGLFWIHVAGPGSLQHGWRKVRASGHTEMAKNLGAYPDEPEFIAMDLGQRIVCAVTTEEDGIWITAASIGHP